ncbi:hypothetical protein L484_019827 [Morus notabilis]|uniref:Uncharacterized protein n=1 Tax=Morus notabilis TaxID=981085 RepID=W9RU09_9ROSA|nr:hypothetical protein L484_019827 [Morus notabilis]
MDGDHWFFLAQLHNKIGLLCATPPQIWWICGSLSPCAGGQWLTIILSHILYSNGCNGKITVNTADWWLDIDGYHRVSQLDTDFVAGY